MAKFNMLKSKMKEGSKYPVKFEVTAENADDLLAFYAWANFSKVTVSRFYEDSGRDSLAVAVRELDKKCLFDAIKRECTERGVQLPRKPRK